MEDPEKEKLFTHEQEEEDEKVFKKEGLCLQAEESGEGLVHQTTLTDDVTKQDIKEMVENSDVLDDVLNRIELVNLLETFISKRKVA